MKRKILLSVLYFLIFRFAAGQSDSVTITINQCVDSALIYNPTIREAQNAADIQGLAVKIARSNLYPLISTNFSGGYSSEYELNNDYRTGNATVSADQVLWQNGKVKAAIAQASFNQGAAGFSLEAQKQDIIASVKSSYLTCLMQDQLYQTAIENVVKASLFLEYAKERYKVGAARRSDMLKAESDLSEAKFERDSYKNSLARAQNELSRLTGIPAERFSTLEDRWPFDQSHLFDTKLDTLYSLAFHNYPELLSVKDLQLSQQAKVRQVRADLYPRIGINAGYTWSYDPVFSQQKGWYTLLTFRWLIFSGNAQHDKVQVEETREMMYEDQEEEIKIFLIKEIRDRLVNIKEAEEQIKLSKRFMESTSENLEVADAQYKSGIGSMLELADARVNDLLAKQKNIRAITAYQIALINMERLTGNRNENKN